MVEFVIRKSVTLGRPSFAKEYDTGKDQARRKRKDELRIKLPPELEDVPLQVLILAYENACGGEG